MTFSNTPQEYRKWVKCLRLTDIAFLIHSLRWKAGVAATLNYIDLSTSEKSPKLRPYPSWEANKLPIDVQPQEQKTPAGGRLDAEKAQDAGIQLQDNATIISTFRIQVDACDRLWVMDTGLADILGSPKQITPNSILVFDLKTDQLLRRFAIPAEQTKDQTFLANIVSTLGQVN